jgi:multicomponent K+:H+ antiporter subunit A
MNSTIFRTTLRLVAPIIIFFAIYIFLRGHNEPGGGFIAGVILAAYGVLIGLAYGFHGLYKRFRLPLMYMVALGLSLLFLTGTGAMLLGHPFLTSAHHYAIPLLGYVDFPTATFFDLGVCITVCGGLLLTMATMGEE